MLLHQSDEKAQLGRRWVHLLVSVGSLPIDFYRDTEERDLLEVSTGLRAGNQ